MEDVRAEISSVLQSFIPEFCEGQIEDLERSIFNYVISMFEEDKIDSVWGAAFETLYRRKAVELTASLTSDEGYGNGNKMLLKRVLKGEVQIEDLTSMKPYELRPEVFTDVTSGARELQKVIQTFTGVTSTMYTCPKCSSKKCTFTELQMRSADEGATTFVTCVDCSYKWSFEG
jgi:DNA-directed RNA polymerase subunit M/transcription elongation factor TFIIS